MRPRIESARGPHGLKWLVFLCLLPNLAIAQQPPTEVPSQIFPGGFPSADNAARVRREAPAVPPQAIANDAVPPPSGKTIDCGTSLSCPQTFGSMQSYVPTALTPIKTVEINFNIIQKSDGSGNWKSTQADLDALRLLALWANNYFLMYQCTPSDPCPGVTYPTDTKIRLSLENIYFYQSDALWSSTDTGALLAAVFKAHPSARRQINIFFNGGSFGEASAFALLPSIDRNYDQAIVMLGSTTSNGTGDHLKFASSATIVHELGHVFGLRHTYDNSEPSNPASCDYLNDVFCPPTNPFPQNTGWGCDPTQPPAVNTCTNNMMGGVQASCLFSHLQLGKMHRSLSITSAQKYVKPSVCLPPPTGMTLWLPFNDTSAAAVVNAPGKPGAQLGNPAKAAGKVDGAFCFNGSSQYVDVPDYSGLSFGKGPFSFEVWVKRETGDTGVRVIAEKRKQTGSSVVGYSLFLFNGRPGLQLADGGYDNYIAPTTVPADGAWHHLAVTVNRVLPAGGKLYLDGALLWSFDPRKHKNSLDTNAPFRVGAVTLSPIGSFFKGCLDELAAYSRVLTPSEIKALFEAQAAGRCKRYCLAPGASFAAGVTSVDLTAQVCNATALPQAYMSWFEGLPASLCGLPLKVDGPASFSQCSSMVTVPPGTCQAVATQIPRPSGLNGTGMGACYQLSVQSLGNDDVAGFRCDGSLSDHVKQPARPSPPVPLPEKD